MLIKREVCVLYNIFIYFFRIVAFFLTMVYGITFNRERVDMRALATETSWCNVLRIIGDEWVN